MVFVKCKYNPTTSSYAPNYQVAPVVFSRSQRQLPFPLPSSHYCSHTSIVATPTLLLAYGMLFMLPYFVHVIPLGMEHFSENSPTSTSLFFLSLFNEVAAPKTVVIAPLPAFLEVFISYDCPCTHILCVSDTLSFSKTENLIVVGPVYILSSVLCYIHCLKS